MRYRGASSFIFSFLVGALGLGQVPQPNESQSKPNESKSPGNNKFDSSGLKSVGSERKPEELKVSDPKKKKEALSSNELSSEDPTKLEKQIRAIQLILKNEKDRNKKINLYLRLSYLHVSIAKKYGVMRAKADNQGVNESKHLQEAEKILTFLLKNLENNKRMLSTLYNIKGLVSYEMDQPEKTVENFLKSIELNPKNSQAEVMSIFIGEYYFEVEKYDEAIKYYQMFYKTMNPAQKALSDYKVAWSFLNQRDVEKAELQFTKIIKENLDKGIADDSYKDLAFILTQNKNEQELIAKITAFLPNPSLRAKLYYFCLLFYLQNSKGESRELLYREVLNIQKDPYEILKLMALKVSFEKKDIPTNGMVNAILSFDKRLKTVKPEVRAEFFKKEALQLEEDSEFNIRIHVDAYAGRLKTESNLSKVQLGDLSSRLIGIHLNWFPESKRKVILTNLWIDTCVDLKNTACLFALENQFKASVDKVETKEFLKKLQVEILALYDEAYEKDKAKHGTAFVNRLKLFIQSFPTDPTAFRSKKRLFGIYFAEKNFTESLPLAESIFAGEKISDNAQKVLISLFELQRYEQVLNHPVYSVFNSPEIIDIKREASLKSAMLNSTQGNFEKYETDIKQYLATNPANDKAGVVYSDYFKKLVELEQFEKLDKEWKGLDPKIKSSTNFYSLRALFFDKMINSGKIYAIPTFWIYNQDNENNYQVLINRTIHNQKPNADDMKFLQMQSQDKRLYYLNILSVTDSELVVAHLNSLKKLSSEEKKLAYTAALLSLKVASPVFKDEQITQFRDIVPERFLADKELPIEKSFKNVIFPNSKMSAKTYESYVVNNVDNVKFLRNRLIKALPSATVVQKIRLLDKMIQVEKSMGESIKNSPAPSGLTGDQLQEYQNGLAEMAKEYFTQADNFSAAKIELEAKSKADAESDLKDILPIKSNTNWPVNQNENFSKLKLIFDQVGIKAGIIYLDNLLQKKTIALDEYYDLKTWLYVQINPSEAARKIYRAELISANQERIIEKWTKQ